MEESASHHVNKSVSFLLRGSANEKLILKGFLRFRFNYFHQKTFFPKNLKIIIFILAGSVWVETGTFEDCSRKLAMQRKMHLRTVSTST